MHQFDPISTVSEKMMQRLPEKGIPVEKTVLFPNWVDTGAIAPLAGPSRLRHQLGLGPERVVLMYAGNMGMKQGLELLPLLAQEFAPDPRIHFVFCGDGAYHAQLAGMLRGAANVTMLPLQPYDRLNDLLNAADIHLLPQRPDAADLVMPSKLTGMLASGRPVIATAAAGTQVAMALDRAASRCLHWTSLRCLPRCARWPMRPRCATHWALRLAHMRWSIWGRSGCSSALKPS